MQTKRHEGRDEPILDPDLPIIDSHHHLFDLPNNRYMVDDFLADVNAGHRIVASIYCETQAFSRKSGPEWMRPVGEVEFANGVGAMTATGVYGPCQVCAGIVGHANLTFGSKVGELLDRCLEAAPDRFRGVRHVTIDYPDDRPFKYVMTYKPPAGVMDTTGSRWALPKWKSAVSPSMRGYSTLRCRSSRPWSIDSPASPSCWTIWEPPSAST